MEREIKFKVWDIQTGKMIYWDEIVESGGGDDMSYFLTNSNFRKYQFIGVCDEDNKEIYEGDIVAYKHTGEKRLVEFSNFGGRAAFGLSNGDKIISFPEDYADTGFECWKVVGHICQDKNIT